MIVPSTGARPSTVGAGNPLPPPSPEVPKHDHRGIGEVERIGVVGQNDPSDNSVDVTVPCTSNLSHSAGDRARRCRRRTRC